MRRWCWNWIWFKKKKCIAMPTKICIYMPQNGLKLLRESWSVDALCLFWIFRHFCNHEFESVPPTFKVTLIQFKMWLILPWFILDFFLQILQSRCWCPPILLITIGSRRRNNFRIYLELCKFYAVSNVFGFFFCITLHFFVFATKHQTKMIQKRKKKWFFFVY